MLGATEDGYRDVLRWLTRREVELVCKRTIIACQREEGRAQIAQAAMMGAGLPSLLSMAGTTDIPGYINTFFNGMPQYDGSLVNPSMKFYMERSAISYSDRVTTPLLILHGGNDERVPIGQPMEFYRALKDRGKIVELVFYPREGHGFGEYYHQLDRMKREYEWIAKYTLASKVIP